MEIEKELNQLERNALRQRFREHLEEGGTVRVMLFPTHIVNVLSKPYCFKVKVFPKDYDTILICAGLPLTGSTYCTLSKAVMFIKEHQGFLLEDRDGGLNGGRVQHYLKQLSEIEGSLPERFIALGDCLLQDDVHHPSGGINVTEGMHKLVAYGLAADMSECHFPITVYFGTNLASLPLEVN